MNGTEDVSLEDIFDWKHYCIHHSDMDAHQYVNVDVPLN
jgi:hypothetical protein